MLRLTLASTMMLLAACAQAADQAPPPAPFESVSDLVPLPEFIPGMGALHVDPATLPAGPFRAYDRSGEWVSTIYMIPLDDLNARAAFDDLSAGDLPVDHVDLVYNAGHPGVAEPHYHIVLWHVPADREADLQ